MERVELSDSDVAYLVGKSGATRMRLEKFSGCRLTIDRENGAELEGDSDQRELAKLAITITLQQRNGGRVDVDFNDLESRPNVATFDVPTDTVGFLLGAKGITLRNIESKHRVFMFFDNERVRQCKSGPCKRLYVIGGRMERKSALDEAEDLVRLKLTGESRGGTNGQRFPGPPGPPPAGRPPPPRDFDRSYDERRAPPPHDRNPPPRRDEPHYDRPPPREPPRSHRDEGQYERPPPPRAYEERRHEERRAYDERRYDERRYDERRVDERRVDERRVDERRVDDERRYDERRIDERRVDERRYDERRHDERRPYDEHRYDERRYDERRYDERRPDERDRSHHERGMDRGAAPRYDDRDRGPPPPRDRYDDRDAYATRRPDERGPPPPRSYGRPNSPPSYR